MKNDNPFVSVLMCVFNESSEWISVSINSILNQTYNNFEFIIVNDNPLNNNNKNLLESYEKKDKRISVIKNQYNLGLTKSLNIGLKLAKGDYIARMDADDFSYPERLKIQIDYLQNNPDYIACSGLAYTWDGLNIRNIKYVPTSYPDILYYSFTSSPFIHPLLMINKKLLDEKKLTYDEDYKRSQDYKLAVEMIKVGKIGNINIPLLCYRKSAKQISNCFGWEQDLLTKHIRRNLINWYYKKYNFPPISDEININTIKENYIFEKKIIINNDFKYVEMQEFIIVMNCIRRLMYYSISNYSFCSLFLFLKSKDYFRKPYNLRRFIIIIIKHFNANIVSKLL